MAGRHRVTLIPGDGIGPEVAAAARAVLDAADAGIEWIERRAGAAAVADGDELLPEDTLDTIRETRVAIKGPITTPVGSGFRSVNVALRQELDLFAAVRPARSLPGVPTRHGDVDIVVIRENTEDLYRGIEFAPGTPQAEALPAAGNAPSSPAPLPRFWPELPRHRALPESRRCNRPRCGIPLSQIRV